MAKMMTNHDKLLVLWSISKYNDAIDAYREADRNYCLGKGTWERVLECQREAKWCGASDDKLLEIDFEVMNSITDAELYEAIYG